MTILHHPRLEKAAAVAVIQTIGQCLTEVANHPRDTPCHMTILHHPRLEKAAAAAFIQTIGQCVMEVANHPRDTP
eukprot:scaffold181537_cov53-Cyclotella_meneghiniana.AAC.1